MTNSLRSQIRNNLASRKTDDLVAIWENGDTDQWDEQVFEILPEILLDRLGRLPSQSRLFHARKILNEASTHLDSGELDRALKECSRAIRLKPGLAAAYTLRGEIHDEMGEPEKAMADYRMVLRLDPGLSEAWKNLLDVERELEAAFQDSPAGRHLDRALEHALNDEPEKAFKACQKAEQTLPDLAAAHNRLGMILEELEYVDLAVDSYLKAIEANPRFYAARENLANARLKQEEELYRSTTSGRPAPAKESAAKYAGLALQQDPAEGAPVPQWVYMDEKTYLLPGWPGHRTRQGRSGYDPLDQNCEHGHMQGVLINLVLNRKLRTRNPVYLILMTVTGLLYSLPLMGIIPLMRGDWTSIPFLVIYSPYWIAGIALLLNVILSLQLTQADETSGMGRTFF